MSCDHGHPTSELAPLEKDEIPNDVAEGNVWPEVGPCPFGDPDCTEPAHHELARRDELDPMRRRERRRMDDVRGMDPGLFC